MFLLTSKIIIFFNFDYFIEFDVEYDVEYLIFEVGGLF